VPSIVYGLWAALTFRSLISPVEGGLQDVGGWFPLFSPTGISGGTIFFIGIVLSIMVLPIVTALSREVFDQTPVTHKEGALALGATRWEMIRTAVLPFGQPGVISASMLALGRALGETIAVTIIVSQIHDFSWSIFSGGETFASKIANNAAEFDSPTKAGAFIAAGLVLFFLTFVVNAAARVVIERRKAFTE
jgi:phosphate transport system permease protein